MSVKICTKNAKCESIKCTACISMQRRKEAHAHGWLGDQISIADYERQIGLQPYVCRVPLNPMSASMCVRSKLTAAVFMNSLCNYCAKYSMLCFSLSKLSICRICILQCSSMGNADIYIVAYF